MVSSPKISVLTTTHNGEHFLPDTIDSILRQTWREFEYIIVDDCSTDNTFNLLQHYATRDERIVVMQTNVRLGPAGAANLGWRRAQGEFVANLDHDDLAMPDRLAKQLDFLRRHPSVGVVGAKVTLIDKAGDPILDQTASPAQISYPASPACVRWNLHFIAPIHHSMMMIRREMLAQVGGYSPRYAYACDFELISRVASITEISNLSECLGAYRRHQQQTSVLYPTAQNGMVLLVIARLLRQRLREFITLEDALALYQCQPSEASLQSMLAVDPTVPSRAFSLIERVYTRFIEDERPSAEDLAWIDGDYVRRAEFLKSLISTGLV